MPHIFWESVGLGLVLGIGLYLVWWRALRRTRICCYVITDHAIEEHAPSYAGTATCRCRSMATSWFPEGGGRWLGNERAYQPAIDWATIWTDDFTRSASGDWLGPLDGPLDADTPEFMVSCAHGLKASVKIEGDATLNVHSIVLSDGCHFGEQKA